MNKIYLTYARTLYSVIRALLFEKYTQVITVAWFGFFAIVWIVFLPLHWSFSVTAMVIALIGYRFFYTKTLVLKQYLIALGDYVEYTPIDTSSSLDSDTLFKTCKILRRLKKEEVQLSGGFEKAYIEYYDTFFLCEEGNKNIFIPYEWILRIETEVQH